MRRPKLLNFREFLNDSCYVVYDSGNAVPFITLNEAEEFRLSKNLGETKRVSLPILKEMLSPKAYSEFVEKNKKLLNVKV